MRNSNNTNAIDRDAPSHAIVGDQERTIPKGCIYLT
eukprot:CAMPEP_0198298390 /NCGR_PEP_ID=MMETSP1449-20131203/40814_1 /TAXON_ID=420275 /ORGANISM="Attheya septentrionalis, Strain CCMP2084" /LENGTH=35 /DNA_ID= /DNA_START= /DNA_END= /DNA_ORIENTATION=